MLATSEHSNSESSILPNSSALGSMACVDREGRARHLSCSVAISRRSGRQPPSSSDHHEVGRGSSRSGRNLAQDKRFSSPTTSVAGTNSPSAHRATTGALRKPTYWLGTGLWCRAPTASAPTTATAAIPAVHFLPPEGSLTYGISEQLAELFRCNEGNTLGAEIARRALPAPTGQQTH